MRRSRASACGDEQSSPKSCADTTQTFAMLGAGSGRRRCRGGAVWTFRGFVESSTEIALGASDRIAGFGIFPTFLLLTATPLRVLLPPSPRLPSPPPLFPPPPSFPPPPPLPPYSASLLYPFGFFSRRMIWNSRHCKAECPELEQREHRMGSLSLRRWPRMDNIALLLAVDFSHSSRLYWLITARRSIPVWTGPTSSLACEFRRRTAA